MSHGQGTDAVIFDMGFTLIEHRVPSAVCLGRALRGSGLRITNAGVKNAQPAKPVRFSSVGTDDACEAWENSLLDYYFTWLDRLGVGRTKASVCVTALARYGAPENWRARRGANWLLRLCYERGWRLGLLSNWGPGLDAIVQTLGWSNWFSVVRASAVTGKVKPDPEAFLEIVIALGASPARTWFVGDDLRCDYFGARRVGMKAVLVGEHVLSPRYATRTPLARSLRHVLAIIDNASLPASGKPVCPAKVA